MILPDASRYFEHSLPADRPLFADGSEPVWELLSMYPPQGAWSVEDYLELTDGTNRRIEYDGGRVEFLSMPTEEHQDLIAYLFDLIRSVAVPERGKAYFSGLRVKTGAQQFREPDVVFVLRENFAKRDNRFWTGADLAIEVVSDDPKDRDRDYQLKVKNYAAAGIAEYWIVDPQESKITVLTLPEGAKEYAEHGVFKPGGTATSKLLEGFAVDVKACFDAAKA